MVEMYQAAQIDTWTRLVGASTLDRQMDTLTRACRRLQGQRLKRAERQRLKRQFLMEYAEHPVAQEICKRIGISRPGFYQWLKTDARFKTKYEALSAVYYDIWLWSDDKQWEAHLKLRKQGHQLIRYYLKKDIQIPNHQTMKDVRREQRGYRPYFGDSSEWE